MAKFKKGDKVRVVNSDDPYKVGETGLVVKIEGDIEGENIYLDIHPGHCILGRDLELVTPRTIRDIQVGDVIVSESGKECTVVMRVSNIVVYEWDKSGKMVASNNLHIDEIADKFKLKAEPTKVKEMTVAEISEKLGYEVKVIK